MDQKGYIALVRRFRSRKKKLHRNALMILQLFPQKESISVTELWNSMEGPLFKVAPKNVQKRFNQFVRLNLIFDTHMGRGRKRLYSLTPEGVYFLMVSDGYLKINAKSFFENYSEDELIQTFLYQVVSKNTVKNVTDLNVYRELLDYLHKCCIEVESVLSQLQKIGDNTIAHDMTSSVLRLLEFLRRETGYNGLDYTLRKDDIRRIVYVDAVEANYILNLKNGSRALTIKRKGQKEVVRSLNKEKLDFDFESVTETTTMYDFLIDRLQDILSSAFYANVTNIIINNIENPRDLETLSRDDKFMAIASELNSKFSSAYGRMKRLRG